MAQSYPPMLEERNTKSDPEMKNTIDLQQMLNVKNYKIVLLKTIRSSSEDIRSRKLSVNECSSV